jgi:hypothetical protein
VSPGGHFVNHQQDPYGNWMARFVFPEPVREFRIEVDLVADMTVYNPFDFFVEDSAEHWPFDYPDDLKDDLVIYRTPEPEGPLPGAVHGVESCRERTRTVDFLVGAERGWPNAIGYTIRMEPGVQTPEETLELRDRIVPRFRLAAGAGAAPSGLRGAVRLGLPDPAEAGQEGAGRAVGHGSRLHRPARLGRGLFARRGLDRARPDIGASDGREPHSAGRDAALPQRRADQRRRRAPEVEFSFDMEVAASRSIRAITKPFTDDQLGALDATRRKVDAALAQGDVRLTMGGEPTFVSIDDFESGRVEHRGRRPDEARPGRQLIRRLRDRFAPGGFLHYGQGKWYPGETCRAGRSRSTGGATGSRSGAMPALIAAENARYRRDGGACRALPETMAEALGLEPDYVAPPMRTRRVDPEGRQAARERDARELQAGGSRGAPRIARVFERGLTEPAGHVLPVQRWQSKASGRKWRSEKWKTRRGKLFLVPGDSAVGYRLPLGSLPYLPPSEYPLHLRRRSDAFRAGPLPDYHDEAERTRRRPCPRGDPRTPAADTRSRCRPRADRCRRRPSSSRAWKPIGGAVRTAISVEPRDGKLCVFMPPVEDAEDYLDLIAAAEDRRGAGPAVHIEGYARPTIRA